MVYSEMPWKPFFRIVGILPLLYPPFVVAAWYILLFGLRGVMSDVVCGQSPLILGFSGLWGVQTIASFSVCIPTDRGRSRLLCYWRWRKPRA